MTSYLTCIEVFYLADIEEEKVKKNTIYIQKSELDQFYTSKEIAKKCYDKVWEKYNINKIDLILEPSAGDGSFCCHVSL